MFINKLTDVAFITACKIRFGIHVRHYLIDEIEKVHLKAPLDTAPKQSVEELFKSVCLAVGFCGLAKLPAYILLEPITHCVLAPKLQELQKAYTIKIETVITHDIRFRNLVVVYTTLDYHEVMGQVPIIQAFGFINHEESLQQPVECVI